MKIESGMLLCLVVCLVCYHSKWDWRWNQVFRDICLVSIRIFGACFKLAS